MGLYCQIIFLLSIMNAMPLREYNNINIIDDAYFYPNSGIYLEPSGQYLQYSGSITIPFSYSLPSLKILNDNYCPGHDSIRKIHTMALDHIKDIVTPSRKNNIRSKRSLFPIVALLTGGLSVWNTVELQSVRHNLLWMNNNALHINNVISNLTESQHIVVDNVKTLMGMVGDHSRLINHLLNVTECNQRSGQIFQMYVSNWLYYAPMEFISAYSGAITGKLTPELLSARNLRNVLSTHAEMDNTLYREEPEIVYEFGKVILTEVVVDSTAFLKGIIQLPKLLAIAPTPMYTTYTVNILNGELDYKYHLPSTLICNSPGNCWDVDHNMCIRETYRLVCLYGTRSVMNKCILGLHNNNTEGCTYSIRQHIGADAIQTKSGILLGGTTTFHQMYKRFGDIDTKSDLIHPASSSRLLGSDNGDWLTINGSIYSTRIIGFDYNSSIYITPPHSLNHKVDSNLVTVEWKSMKDVQFKPLTPDDYNFYTITIVFIISLLSLIGITTLWCIIKKQKEELKNREKDKPLIGLR